MVDEVPKCPHCGSDNCASCIARGLLTRVSALHAELPQLTPLQREAERGQAPALALRLAVHELMVEQLFRGLRIVSTGRFALCSDHALPERDTLSSVQRLEQMLRSTGFDESGIVATLRDSPAVQRHTLRRFAELWTILRDNVADMPIEARQGFEPEGLADVFVELDALARGVLP